MCDSVFCIICEDVHNMTVTRELMKFYYTVTGSCEVINCLHKMVKQPEHTHLPNKHTVFF